MLMNNLLTKREAKTIMIKMAITMQELRKKIYIKAKAEKSHRFWGMYVHVNKAHLRKPINWPERIMEHQG